MDLKNNTGNHNNFLVLKEIICKNMKECVKPKVHVIIHKKIQN